MGERVQKKEREKRHTQFNKRKKKTEKENQSYERFQS